MWMNQNEIEWAAQQKYNCPNLQKAVNLLWRLMEAVNRQSDGWPYWKTPAQAAAKLMTLVHTAGRHGQITNEELRKAITPIRAMVTRQNKVQAKYGNTFNFDVDAALKQS